MVLAPTILLVYNAIFCGETAEDAAAYAARTVPVRTAEAAVDAYLSYSLAVALLQIRR